MSFLGAGFAIGAAKAITGRLKDKQQKEEARFAFIKEAVDKGLSEFETEVSQRKLEINKLYDQTRDYVISQGVIPKGGFTKDESDIIEADLGQQSLNYFVTDPITNNKILNPNLTIDAKTKDALINSVTKIGIAKLLDAQKSPNFDITNDLHREAILDARLGAGGQFKAKANRHPAQEGKTGDLLDQSIVSDGFKLENYVSQPVAEKVGLGKRISNFFNPMDEQEAIAQYAKDNNLSIAQTERLFRAGQTEELDAFKDSDLRGQFAEVIGGDLPDVSLSNLQTLIPTDADTIQKIEANILKTITSGTVDDAIYINPALDAIPDNINFDATEKVFKNREGEAISNDDLIKIYQPYTQGKGTMSLTEVLPAFNANTDKRHRNDPNNLTPYYKYAAATLSAVTGEEFVNMTDLSNRLKSLGKPSLDTALSEDQVIQRTLEQMKKLGIKYRLGNLSKGFGLDGDAESETMSVSQFLAQEIMPVLYAFSVPSENIVPVAHEVLRLYISDSDYTTTQGNLSLRK